MNNLYMRNTASHRLDKYKNNLLKAVNSKTKRIRKDKKITIENIKNFFLKSKRVIPKIIEEINSADTAQLGKLKLK